MLTTRAGIRLAAAGVLGSLVAGGALLTAHPAAAAVPDLVRIANETGTDSSDTKSITANCPGSSPALLSAGYRLDGGLGDVVLDQLVLGAGSATAVAYETDPDYLPTWDLEVYAVCADPVPGRILIPALATFGSPDTASISLTCPAGDALLGAGFAIGGASANGEIEVDDLRPNGGTLTAPTASFARAYETDPLGPDWTLTTYGMCADPLPGLVRRTATTASGALDFKQILVSCEEDEVLVGSGYEILGGPTGEVVVDDMELDGDTDAPPTSVEVNAYREDGYTDVWELQGFALCATA
jgi:hypothetical protein